MLVPHNVPSNQQISLDVNHDMIKEVSHKNRGTDHFVEIPPSPSTRRSLSGSYLLSDANLGIKKIEFEHFKYTNDDINDTVETESFHSTPNKKNQHIPADSQELFTSLQDTILFIRSKFISFLGSNEEFISILSTIKMIKLKSLVHGCFDGFYLSSNYWLFPCKNMLMKSNCQHMSICPRHHLSNMLCSYCTNSNYCSRRQNRSNENIRKRCVTFETQSK